MVDRIRPRGRDDQDRAGYRLKVGAEGFEGATAGAPGRFMINGEDAAQANKMVMQPGDKVVLETPGGGGYGKLK